MVGCHLLKVLPAGAWFPALATRTSIHGSDAAANTIFRCPLPLDAVLSHDSHTALCGLIIVVVCCGLLCLLFFGSCSVEGW